MRFPHRTLLSSPGLETHCTLSRLLPFFALVLSAALPVSVVSQRTISSIAGNVNDSAGVIIVGFTVTEVNTAHILSRFNSTHKEGKHLPGGETICSVMSPKLANRLPELRARRL